MKRGAAFDPATGRLRLTRAALVEMCALHAGAEVSPGSDLPTTGLLDGGQVHPRLVPVVELAARPLARLVLDVASGSPVHCQGWVGESHSLLLAAPNGAEEVFDGTFLSRSLLTSQLARFVALGPRPRGKVTEPIEMDLGLLEALLGGGGGLAPDQLEMLIDPSDEVVPAWLEVLALLSTAVRSRWRVGIWWNSHEESPAARSLEVIDSAAGLFLVSHVARGPRPFARVRLLPVTPTQVWRLLSVMLPAPEEVAGPLQP